MSAGRRHRRAAARWVVRRPDVELSASARAGVARVLAAHDDPAVSETEFFEVMVRWHAEVAVLSEAERLEASLQVHDHAARNLYGRPGLRSVAVVYPGER